jgi:hypothetical protein
MKATTKALAGMATFAALPHRSDAGALNPAQPRPIQTAATQPTHGAISTETLRIATCQFPVSGTPAENGDYIRGFMEKAAASGAHLLHTSEASLSGYAGIDFPAFVGFDWEGLRQETTRLRELAKQLKLWLVLGSAHLLDLETKPTNCLYLIDPEGRIADRYDICWPQLYIGYREKGATVMVHSFHNARSNGPNCLDTPNVRQVPTRCADNRLWAVCNNSSQPYSHWGSFIARPDATIAKQLGINQFGMLMHDFPDGLSEGGWFHNYKPMQKPDDEIMSWGTPTRHPRQLDGQAEP